MKGIRILCVGKVKEAYFRDGIGYFLKQLRKYCPAEILECADEPTPDGASEAEEEQIRQKEGERLLQKVSSEDTVIALCIDGKHYSSDAWRKWIKQKKELCPGYLVFIIGGSLGLSQQVVKRADETLSFSVMTFPHQMMRMILCEQIVRSFQE